MKQKIIVSLETVKKNKKELFDLKKLAENLIRKGIFILLQKCWIDIKIFGKYKQLLK